MILVKLFSMGKFFIVNVFLLTIVSVLQWPDYAKGVAYIILGVFTAHKYYDWYRNKEKKDER